MNISPPLAAERSRLPTLILRPYQADSIAKLCEARPVGANDWTAPIRAAIRGRRAA